MNSRLALLAALVLGLGGQALAGDWGRTDDEWAGDPSFAKSKSLCRAVAHAQPPIADRPDKKTAAALTQDCDSEALYYGIGAPPDPVKARLCAFVEARDATRNNGLQAQGLLMTIYANGVGAKRDFDVTMHLACGLDSAAAESDERVLHLAKLKAERWSGRDFSFCQDITSGFAGGQCARHDLRLSRQANDAKIAKLTAGWTKAEREALNAMQAAQHAYAAAEGDVEYGFGGTSAGAQAAAAEMRINREAVELLQALAKGALPQTLARRYAHEDAQLNAAYAQARRDAADDEEMRKALKAAERAWLRWRDAFIALAKAKFPAVPPDAAAAWLSQKRIRMLNGEWTGR